MVKKDTGDVSYTQHFTTRSEYIIGNLWKDIPDGIEAVEPFYGSGDLIKFQPYGKVNEWEYYDMDLSHCENKDDVVEQDTLLNPPCYRGKFVITNPPYLAKNKTENKETFDKYQVDDLYKASIISVMTSEGGILVVPLNFFTDKRTHVVRKSFLEKFFVPSVNIFRDPVFDNTNYQICSFSFIKRRGKPKNLPRIYIWENEKKIVEESVDLSPKNSLLFNKEYNDTFGNSMYYSYSRLIRGKEYENIIPIVFHLTDKSKKGYEQSLRNDFSHAIYADYGDSYYGKNTDRSKASFSINKNLDIDWEQIAKDWNYTIRDYRQSTYNIGLTSFRDVSRKRLSYTEATRVLDSLIYKQIENN